MATKTTNYSMTKPDTSDYYDIAIPNANMDIIDAQLKTNADSVAAQIPKSLATASDQVLVSTGAGAWVAKTLAQIKTWLGLGGAAYLNTGTANGTVATGDHSHTGVYAAASHTQTASTISDFAATVMSTVLTSLSSSTNAVITTADSVLTALGKLQVQITAHLADYIRNPGYVADTGAVNAIAIAPSPALTAYADGVVFNIKMRYTNTSAAVTVNASALGVKTAYRADGTALAIGDLVLNKAYEFSYNSTIGGFTVYGIEQAQITSHVGNTSNPHSTTAAQVGALPIAGGTLGGQLAANASAVTTLTTAQVRNVYAGTADLTAGSTALNTGDIYCMYV